MIGRCSGGLLKRSDEMEGGRAQVEAGLEDLTHASVSVLLYMLIAWIPQVFLFLRHHVCRMGVLLQMIVRKMTMMWVTRSTLVFILQP